MKRWLGRVVGLSDGMLVVELTASDHEGPTLVADFATILLEADLRSVVAGDIFDLTAWTGRGGDGHPV
jgi:hypothetical protein